jgi:hypothetical protein
MARPARLERATLCLEGRCSIQLSYGRAVNYCNSIIELAVVDLDSPRSHLLCCARNGVRPPVELQFEIVRSGREFTIVVG